MNISCEIIHDLLPLYCDKVCSLDSRKIVEIHLKTCKKCRADMRFIGQDMKTSQTLSMDSQIAKTFATAGKCKKPRVPIKGYLIVCLSVALLVAGYCFSHWFSTAHENDLDALGQQAADYFGYDNLLIEQVEQRGCYLAALCQDTNGNWCMCVFDRDHLFKNRWRASGGKPQIEAGIIGSWNYGSPQNEAILIFCGGNILNSVYWYKFQNSNITYICPVENNKVLDVFIIPDNSDISSYPILLDYNQQEIRNTP